MPMVNFAAARMTSCIMWEIGNANPICHQLIAVLKSCYFVSPNAIYTRSSYSSIMPTSGFAQGILGHSAADSIALASLVKLAIASLTHVAAYQRRIS